MDYKSNGPGVLSLAGHMGVSKSINLVSPISRNNINLNKIQHNNNIYKANKYSSLPK